MKKDPSFQFKTTSLTRSTVAGKRVVIVGGTGGIGRAFSRELAGLGASVLVVGQTFRDTDIPSIEFWNADLSLMREAQRIADLLPAEELDLLIFTTGIFASPLRQETPEGIERDLAVSYLNRRVMLQSIAPRLGAGRSAGQFVPRVFLMGYPGGGQNGSYDDLNAERSYKAMPVHMNTVAGNEMLVLEGAKRWANASFYGLNPGLIKTNIRDNLLGQGSFKSRVLEGLIGLLTPTPQEYAKRIAPLFFAPELDGHSGAMFDRKGVAILPSSGLTDEHIGRFMAASDTVIQKANRAHH
ncbi:SDR family NAD(P)-dependent oxidoreductase [Cupriavidus agavae]|uniref:NAD(P)-dependent dehydrogenase (Short-subunit alcohol dehydrogenase family) n=1 Tax=Cupriavidus agavae TaxID=1001822 RepID=A0A4V2FEA0_9BURK|nr:SDR family NAD(P)-dependent oxidoreductase [Cupriavidus agavae]RZT29049.1 NAD(P)-dependent dehydrogenase (short-subunit alcohol dehydrogenase family) [Cupriavidus agavae]